jgi:hypothetical protein
MKKWLILAALALAWAPSSARADWLFTPNLGSTFGGDADAGITYGASIAWMSAGILGVEADVSFTPDILNLGGAFDDAFGFDLVDSGTTSFMGNVIVGVPFGGTAGAGFRPYVAGGLGWMNLNLEDNLDDNDLFEGSTDSFAVNVGGGVTGFFTDSVGARGDVRWYRGFVDDDSVPGGINELRNIDFWRATAGITFRW